MLLPELLGGHGNKLCKFLCGQKIVLDMFEIILLLSVCNLSPHFATES